MTRTILAAGMAACFVTVGAQAQDSITFASWGGSFQAAERIAFLDPAEDALGIVIKEDTLNGLADLRAQVQSGAPQWDIAEFGSNSCATAVLEGLAEPLDYSVINTDGVIDKVIHDYYVGIIFYSTVLTYSTQTYSGTTPRTWADFFDTGRFPGTRSLYAKPYSILEIALLADGVPKDQIYPIDVDRAFDKLAELKSDVAVWWKSGAQSAQLAKDHEVDMIAAWNGRVGNAQKDGAQIEFGFDEAILDYDCLLVPKGAKNKELAMKALNEFLKPENQAELPFHIDYGPVNLDAFDVPNKITPEMAAKLPSSPANAEKSLVFDPTWWASRVNELQERYDLFLQE